MNKPPTILQMALGQGTPEKAFFTALIVGSILTLINHGDVMINGGFTQLWKPMLTYCIPYCVTTWGAILGKKAQWEADHNCIISWSELFFKKVNT